MIIISVLGVIVIIGFGIAVYVIYETYSFHSNRSFVLYITGLLLSGFASVVLLGSFIVDSICTENSGAACGLGIMALLQPLYFTIGAAIFLYFWARAGRRA